MKKNNCIVKDNVGSCVFCRTWSSVSRSASDTGWPDSATNDITPDAKDSQWNSSQPPGNTFADSIPEFEPGKPWKVGIYLVC